MATIPAKVRRRFQVTIKKFQDILENAKQKDVNESDTVVIITDILSAVFGYDKYSEITSEYSIKKTYCDLAIKIDNKVFFLIEVKAIGIDLKNDHLRQVVDYGSNLGIEWVLLTNGICWRLYKIIFGKPISDELVFEFNLLQLNPKKDDELEFPYFISRESIGKSALENYHTTKKTLNRYFLAQLILSDHVLDVIRKCIKKIAPDLKISNDSIFPILENEVLKRDVLEGDKVIEAKKKISRAFKTTSKREIPEEITSTSQNLPGTGSQL